MKLLKLRVDGFGPLHGEWTFAPGKVNVILDDNERGKSSLFSAITAALYGLGGDRRTHRVVTPVERWRPWDGGAFRVTLDLECANGIYAVTRDFDRGTVAVFDRSGSEVTADFVEGHEVPVGTKLLGLDRDEFEKCALVLQGDLDLVVPADEKARRASTLKARLENAADTHLGDTNASEAAKVLEEALRRYHAPELDFTGTIDNAIDRLVAKRELIEIEIRELDAALDGAQEPLERLHRLAQEERQLQDQLRDLENERRAGMAVEVRRQLDDHEQALAEVARLEAEAGGLTHAARLPANAEGELRELIAQHEGALKNVEALESRRREELARERDSIARERKDLAVYDSFTPEDADRCVAQASELRHLLMQDALLRHQAFELRESLAARGHQPDAIQFLQHRFGRLPEPHLRMLRQQAEMTMQYQNEGAALDQRRAAATETLREVEATRSSRRLPGWVFASIAAAGVLGSGVLLAVQGESVLSLVLLIAGVVSGAIGGTLLATGARSRVEERDEAQAHLADSQQRLNELHRKRADNATAVADLARLMGCHDSIELLRQFGEYARMLEDAGPLMRVQEQLEGSDERRKRLLEQVRPLLLRISGGSNVTPELLDKIAYEARRSLNARQRLADLERGFGWIDEEKRLKEAEATALKERALRLLHAAGVTHDPTRGWPHHVHELKKRLEGRVRYGMVTEELIPAAKRRLHPDHEVQQRKRQLEMLTTGGDMPVNARPATDIEGEVKLTRTKLEETRSRRADTRVEVEEVWRRHAQRRPDLAQDQERLGRAIERARQFKLAVEIARSTIERVAMDTHRRWAEFLNDRVAAILVSFGTSVEGLRFGEDLDFSVQMDGGPLVSRGKAHAQLSTGARDQLYLAVRLAISEFLSHGGEPLPILLDDVFATTDDHRLRSAMSALVDGFGAGHQLFLATCHRSRILELQRQDPAMYRERVHFVDLGQGAGARR